MRYAAITVCALILGVSASACGHLGGPRAGMMQGGFAMPVSAAPITRGNILETFSVTSSVAPKQQASLSSVVSGNVLMVAAQIGERVGTGELLVKIDDSTLLAQRDQAAARLAQLRAGYTGGVTSAQANLASAKVAYDTDRTNLWREQQLLNQGYVSKSDYDRLHSQAIASEAAWRAAQVAAQNASLSGDESAAIADLRNAQAAVRTIDAQIAQTNVSAPFDGVVTARNVDKGTLAAPGVVLMEVAQLDPVFVDAGISSSDLPHVAVGTPVTVTVASIPGRVWHARVAYLNLAAVPGSLTYKARIQVANPDLALRGGMVARVAIERARKSGVLLAPRASVYETDAGYAMFIIDNSACPAQAPPTALCAKSIPVDVGISNDQEAEVSAPDLKPGVQAILNHSVALQPGTPVQLLPPGGPPGAGPGGGPQAKPQQGKPQGKTQGKTSGY